MANKVVKHSKKPRGHKISEADWNQHRERILYLWLQDGGKGRSLNEVVEIMKGEHNFTAT